MSRKLTFAVSFIGAFYIASVNAVPVTLDANYFPPGTDISNAINHFTLQEYAHQAGSSTIDYTPAIATNQYSEGWKWNYLSLGDSNDNFTIGLRLGEPLSFDSHFSGLSVSSDRAIMSFGFSGVGDNGDPVGIYLFDKNNHFMNEYYVDSSGLNTFPVCQGYFSDVTQCVTYNGSLDLSHEANPVYSLWVGAAVDVSAAYIDTITVDTVPEPSGLALLGLGLAMITLLSRNRNSTTDNRRMSSRRFLPCMHRRSAAM